MYSRCIDLLMKSSRTEIKEVLGYCKNDFGLEEMISAAKYGKDVEFSWSLKPGQLNVLYIPMSSGGMSDYSVYSWPSFNQEWNQAMVGPC